MTERIIQAKLTRAGLRAAFAANNAGLQLALSHIGLGTARGAGYAPTGAETALQTEFVRVAIGGGEYLGDFEIALQALFDDASAGWIGEIGVYTDAGVLFAVWSEVGAPLAYKSASVPFVLAMTLAMTDLPAGSVSFVVGAPSVNIMLGEPLTMLATELIRLQRKSIELSVNALQPALANLGY